MAADGSSHRALGKQKDHVEPGQATGAAMGFWSQSFCLISWLEVSRKGQAGHRRVTSQERK